MATSKLCGFQRRVQKKKKKDTNEISKYSNMIELKTKCYYDSLDNTQRNYT
jgi:hypothetical protein